MSEVSQIAQAFIKAKKQFAPAIKNSVNPHFRSKYADLGACIDAVDSAFLENNIVMYQETFEDTAGVTVETILLHVSGEKIKSGKLHVPSQKNDPQGYGSALSYCRRYSLMTACGIAPEDDDGNAAVRAYHGGANDQDAKLVSRPASDSESPAAFSEFIEDKVITFGKYNGKAFREIPTEDLTNYSLWLSKQNLEKPSAFATAFIKDAREVFKQRKEKPNNG